MPIIKIWSNQPGKFFCLSIRHKNHNRDKPLRDVWFEHHQFDRVYKTVRKYRKDYNVWFCPHGFKQPKRQSQYAEQSLWYYADLDAVDPRKIRVKPSIALESSPQRYVGFWYTALPVEWEDNRAWTYLIDADHGGWDPTQVLRAPQSFNHKPAYNTPRVRTLWSNATIIQPRRIKKLLPKTKKKKTVTGGIYRKYEKQIPVMLRRQILSKTQIVKDRSTWIWGATKTLQTVGLTSDEIFEVIWPSGNNKYFDKRRGEEYLKRDIDKALDTHFDRESQEKKTDIVRMFSKSMAEVEEEEINWLWEPYIARGELTIVEGDPGVGKSWLVQMMGIYVADGRNMPTDRRFKQPRRDPQKVFFVDHENSRATVMKARLRANGLRNEHLFFQEDMAFSVDNEEAMEALYAAIEEHQPALVVWDTLMNYAGGANIHNASETAQMFSTFRHIALEYGCASVVVRHLTKNNKERAAYRGQGSITFTGTARCVIGVGYSPDDPGERLFKIVKTNIVDPDSVGARRFTLEGQEGDCLFRFGGTLHITNEDLYNTEKPKPEDDTGLIEFLGELVTVPMFEGKILKATLGRYDGKTVIRGLQKLGARRFETPKGTKWKPPR